MSWRYRRPAGPSALERKDACIRKLATEDLRNRFRRSRGAMPRTWPDSNARAIERFLRQRRIHHPQPGRPPSSRALWLPGCRGDASAHVARV